MMLRPFAVSGGKMNNFRTNIAVMYGVNAAVIAEYIYGGEDNLDEMEFAGKDWFKCSMKQIHANLPFLTIDQIDYALGILRKNKIIYTKKLEKGTFDHTNWYAFSSYGISLMRGGDGE